MLKALMIAFSTYSKIPMPHIEWDEKNMKYSISCFPCVGVVIGLVCIGCFYGLSALATGTILRAVVLSIFPILISGGIHMDGFLDTIDAKSSYRSKKERLQILKDPHVGAFAIIYGIIYMLVCVSLFSEITKEQIVFIAVGYIYSRILSGLSVVTFRKAKKEGMAAETAAGSGKNVKWILVIEFIICIFGMLAIGALKQGIKGIVYACSCIVAGLISFLYYRHMAYKWFDGITGDLAGYFLQICEGMLLLAVVLVKYLV